jgi:hypothetical protein
MRVPQELVDAIIDKVARLDSARRALEACCLTARSSLSRSQWHLLAAIICRRYSSDSIKFDALFSESPHIGELYVRYFTLQLERTDMSELHEKTIEVPPILISAPPSWLHTPCPRRFQWQRVQVLGVRTRPTSNKPSCDALTPLSPESLPHRLVFSQCLEAGVASQPRSEIERTNLGLDQFR